MSCTSRTYHLTVLFNIFVNKIITNYHKYTYKNTTMTSILMQMDWSLVSTVHLASSAIMRHKMIFFKCTAAQESCDLMNEQAITVSWKTCSDKKIPIKRFPGICSNFRTFLFIFHKNYGRKISGIFPAEIFRKTTVIFIRKFPNSQP